MHRLPVGNAKVRLVLPLLFLGRGSHYLISSKLMGDYDSLTILSRICLRKIEASIIASCPLKCRESRAGSVRIAYIAGDAAWVSQVNRMSAIAADPLQAALVSPYI